MLIVMSEQMEVIMFAAIQEAGWDSKETDRAWPLKWKKKIPYKSKD